VGYKKIARVLESSRIACRIGSRKASVFPLAVDVVTTVFSPSIARSNISAWCEYSASIPCDRRYRRISGDIRSGKSAKDAARSGVTLSKTILSLNASTACICIHHVSIQDGSHRVLPASRINLHEHPVRDASIMT
jgi:hypothetical protein